MSALDDLCRWDVVADSFEMNDLRVLAKAREKLRVFTLEFEAKVEKVHAMRETSVATIKKRFLEKVSTH